MTAVLQLPPVFWFTSGQVKCQWTLVHTSLHFIFKCNSLKTKPMGNGQSAIESVPSIQYTMHNQSDICSAWTQINIPLKSSMMDCHLHLHINLYKPYLPYQTDSQDREQMHAILDKLVPSLRQMSYPVFMTMRKGKMQF